ncbi:MAG: hypothetical protein WKF34_07715 [Pyrinomonadaceae bacterium]
MNTLRSSIIFITVSLASLGTVCAQALDISSGGAPSITGASGGSVSGSASVLNNLVVTINFGELSPLNASNIVKVTVPIAVRSNQPYRVTVTYSGAVNANPQALQKTDIGFGLNNWRAMGSDSRVCSNSPHIFYSPFSNDPAATRTFAASGRAQYPSDFGDLNVSTTILTGPRLSNGTNARQTNDGYIFDVIFAITPQFYAAGPTTATLTFTISAGPSVSC